MMGMCLDGGLIVQSGYMYGEFMDGSWIEGGRADGGVLGCERERVSEWVGG